MVRFVFSLCKHKKVRLFRSFTRNEKVLILRGREKSCPLLFPAGKCYMIAKSLRTQ